MGAVQRLATVVIIGLVALSTVLVLYLADENNRIDTTATQQRDDAIARATTNYIALCMTCHGPAGLGLTGPDAKDSYGNRTSRIGFPLGGSNEVLNHTGVDAEGTPWPGATELGVTYPGGFAGRTAWITNRITNGYLAADLKTYIMPAFSQDKGGPLNDTQIEELVEMIQYGDWNKIYNQAIATSGGYPTPGPGPATNTPAAAAPTTAPAAAASNEPTYEIDAEDIAFSTDALSIPANVEVTLNVKNIGASVHTFDSDALNIHSGDIQPGATFTTKIKAAPGKYEYYCDIPGHRAAGMDGFLTADPNLKPPAGSGEAASPAAGTPVPGSASPTSGTPAAVGTPGVGTPGAASSPAASSGAAPLVVDLEDIAFSTDTLTVPANTPTTITITNKGQSVHNFSITELKINTGDVQPGQTVTVTINAPAGTYTYFCDIPGHEAAGMKGTLTVK